MADETKLPPCSHPGGHEFINIDAYGRGIEGHSGNYTKNGKYRCKYCYLVVDKMPFMSQPARFI